MNCSGPSVCHSMAPEGVGKENSLTLSGACFAVIAEGGLFEEEAAVLFQIAGADRAA